MLKSQRIVAFLVLIAFLVNSLGVYLPSAYAQELLGLPEPGVRVALSPRFMPVQLKGIVIHPENPLRFDFIINDGDAVLNPQDKRQEYKKLIKYFLASLAVPDKNQWVNLSPYEKDRIINDDFGKTFLSSSNSS